MFFINQIVNQHFQQADQKIFLFLFFYPNLSVSKKSSLTDLNISGSEKALLKRYSYYILRGLTYYRVHSQKVGHLFFFALKGLYILAQGIALGNSFKEFKP
jgi:hypothetical protein